VADNDGGWRSRTDSDFGASPKDDPVRVRSRIPFYSGMLSAGAVLVGGILIYIISAERARITNPNAVWVTAGVSGDWVGDDFAFTRSDIPKYSVGGVSLCDEYHLGRVAVCWDNRPDGYPSDATITDVIPGSNPAGWCTYKYSNIRLFTPRDTKAAPGLIYVCARPIER
jgi:hypothetical protein